MTPSRTDSSGKTRSITTALVGVALATALPECLAQAAAPQPAAQTSNAAAQAQTFTLNIPPQALGPALLQLAEATATQIVFETDKVAGLKSAAVVGRFSRADALRLVLAGSGFTYRFSSPTTAMLVPESKAGTRVLGPVRVEGQQKYESPQRGEGIAQLGGIRGGQDQEAVGYRAKVASVTTGTPQAIEDVPRSITVMTQEQMQAQDIQSIGDAIKRLPGLTLIESQASPGSGAEIYSRGYTITKMQVDGGAPRALNILGNGLLDLSSYERIELVRGPNGMRTGSDSAGGSLNLVRKRPGSESALDVTTAFNNWKRGQATVDFSTPSILGSAIAFRGVGNYQQEQFFYDGVKRRNSTLYGMFDAPLGERARLEFGLQRMQVRDDGSYQGLPRYIEGDLIPFPHDYNYVPRAAYSDGDLSEVFARLHAKVTDRWNLQLGFNYDDRNYKSVQFLAQGRILKATGGPPPNGTNQNDLRMQATDQGGFGVDFKLAGGFETFGFRHDVLFGADYSEDLGSSTKEAFYSGTVFVKSIADYTPDVQYIPLGIAFPGRGFPTELGWNFKYGTDTRTTNQSLGISVNDTISWRDRVDLALSARRFQNRTSSGGPTWDYINSRYSSFSSSESRSTAAWRPSWYLTVRPYGGFRVFGTYAEGFQSQSTVFDIHREPLGPLTYGNREVGVKYGAQLWEASVTTYKLEQKNVAQAIPNTICPPTPTSPCYFTQGATQESTGLDFELVGRVARDLNVITSFNTSKTRVFKTNLPITTRIPDKSAKAFLEWDAPLFGRTKVRAGASYTGRVFQSGTMSIYDPNTAKVLFSSPYQFAQDATTIYDFGLSRGLPYGLTMDLLVENLTNKQYFSTISSGASYAAAPRTTSLTVRWSDRPQHAGEWSASPTTGMAPFGSPADWYGRIQTGLGDTPDIVGRSDGATPVTWTFETKRGSANFVTLGYRPARAWRVEIEGGLRRTDFTAISGAVIAPGLPNAVCSAATGAPNAPDCADPAGGIDEYSAMATLIRDFGREGSLIRPYLGFGFGPALYSASFGGRMAGVPANADGTGNGPSSFNRVYGNSREWSYAWQAQAGLTVRLTDRAQFDLGYRFHEIPKAGWEAGSFPGRPIELGNFEGRYRSHALAAGLRWNFGAAEGH